MYVAHQCFNELGNHQYSNDLSHLRVAVSFTISKTQNMFTAVGYDTYAEVSRTVTPSPWAACRRMWTKPFA
jgi:hypothetical protein